MTTKKKPKAVKREKKEPIRINSARPLGKTTHMLSGIYNRFIDDQGSVSIGINREKLERLIRDVERTDGWRADIMADAILSNMDKILVKEK